MPNKQLTSAFLDRNDFSSYATGWLYDCEIRQHSARTVELRKLIIEKLEWWLDQKQIERIDVHSLRQFLHYVANGHKEPGGRWGDPLKTATPKPATVQLYHRHIRACLNWIVEEGTIDASPMGNIKAAIDCPDQIQPFSTEHVRPHRYEADQPLRQLRPGRRRKPAPPVQPRRESLSQKVSRQIIRHPPRF